MHRILERQIKRYLGENAVISPELKAFFESVSKTYADLDDDRSLSNRSLEISSKEFLEKGQFLRDAKKEVEEKIKERTESLEKYQILVDNLSVGVYRNTPGPEGRFLEVNPALISMFEADSREEFMKHSVSDFYQDPIERTLFVEKIMKYGFVKNEELDMVTLKGRKIIGSVSAVMVKHKDGVIYFDSIIEDITERKKTEEALKNAHDELEIRVKERTKELGERVIELEDARKAITNLLEDLEGEQKTLAEAKARDDAILINIGDGLVVTDLNQCVVFINLSGERMLGWKTGEIFGKDWFSVVKPKGKKGEEIPLDKFLPQKVLTMADDYHFLKKDGSVFPVSVTASKVFVEGKSIGSVIAFRDVTKETAIERAKSEFVSLASHQLRTPLTGIEWTIERFFKKEKLTDEGKKYLNDIHFSANRLSVLVKLLLNVSRIESGSVGAVPEPLDLVSLFRGYIYDQQVPCDKRNISCVFEEHPEKLIIATDKNLLGYIAQNIISNAIDYTVAGGRVEIVLEEKKDLILFMVRDTGVGIPQKEQARVFEKFFRASNAVRAKPDGTGLGLYITQESARLLGGRIWFESEEGKGSTFFVEFPRVFPTSAEGKGLIL